LIVSGIGLKLEHRRNHLQAVLDAVIDLLEQDFMTIKCGLQFALILLLLNRHPEDVCGTLQKSDVVFAKLAFGFAVDFQHAEWRAVALENDIHGTANAVLNQ